MRFSLIALFLTVMQWAVIGWFKATGGAVTAYNLLIYGSPIYLLRALLSGETAFLKLHPLYLWMILYHVIKYFIILRAKAVEEPSFTRILVVLLEAGYLVYCGIFLFDQ